MLRTKQVQRVAAKGLPRKALSTSAAVQSVNTTTIEDLFKRFGHLEARIDPLGLSKRTGRPELEFARAAGEPDQVARLQEVYCGPMGAEFEHLDSKAERDWFTTQLETLVPAGSEGSFALPTSAKVEAAHAMLKAEVFEQFLGRKYVSLKRYSGEGTEALLPTLEAIFAEAAKGGVKDVVIGQAHRGRLAVLVSCLNLPARKLFNKINGQDCIPASVEGCDDVSSHLASSCEKSYSDEHGKQHTVHVSMLHNPSHLEAVNPVAVGKTRAKRDADPSSNALCLLIHGDAAVYGQGVVAETYAASLLPGYSVGGTVHVITNNQLGFTADQCTSRSSTYASDVAKMVGAPVLHVNAEQVREVLLACKLAVDYRNTFGKDVVIDLIGYRKHGHNELDEPAFTSPEMYAVINARKQAFAHTYADSLVAEGVMSQEQKEAFIKRLNDHLEAEFQEAKKFTKESGSCGLGDGKLGSGTHVVADGTAFGGKWKWMRQAKPDELNSSPATGVDTGVLRAVGKASVTAPAGFKVHDRLVRGHVIPRLQSLGYHADGAAAASFNEGERSLDWATAEALAFGSLLAEGKDVRMTGQDAQRGTFSHRHAVMVDQTAGSKCNLMQEHIASAVPRPLNGASKHGRYHVYSSLLSEFGVLGFEHGYSLEDPNNLVIWEAQFGDFSNGAQIIIDQFISGSETKWLRQSGLTMLLPHGYDGAGPEHSSARIERFLNLVNSQAMTRMRPSDFAKLASQKDDKTARESLNMVVANPTTPANYFHLLRRQMVREYRKPLVVAAPKAILRHPNAKSSLTECAPGTSFQPVITEGAVVDGASDKDVKRVLLVSGKLHLELQAKRNKDKHADTAIVRVEELAPFPTHSIMSAISSKFPNTKQVDWVQEEPANAGVWTWAEAHLAPELSANGLPPLRYIGRPALPTPAVGLSKANKAQQDALLSWALP